MGGSGDGGRGGASGGEGEGGGLSGGEGEGGGLIGGSGDGGRGGPSGGDGEGGGLMGGSGDGGGESTCARAACRIKTRVATTSRGRLDRPGSSSFISAVSEKNVQKSESGMEEPARSKGILRQHRMVTSKRQSG